MDIFSAGIPIPIFSFLMVTGWLVVVVRMRRRGASRHDSITDVTRANISLHAEKGDLLPRFLNIFSSSGFVAVASSTLQACIYIS